LAFFELRSPAEILCGAAVESSSLGAETAHGYVSVVWLGQRHWYGDRGVEEGAALRDFGDALHTRLPELPRCNNGAASDVEGLL